MRASFYTNPSALRDTSFAWRVQKPDWEAWLIFFLRSLVMQKDALAKKIVALLAAQNLGLSSEAWGRQDFIKLITQIAGSLERVSHRLSAASMVDRGLV